MLVWRPRRQCTHPDRHTLVLGARRELDDHLGASLLLGDVQWTEPGGGVGEPAEPALPADNLDGVIDGSVGGRLLFCHSEGLQGAGGHGGLKYLGRA